TFVKETADFTCGLLNPSGEFFAYPVELGVASFGGISYAATLEAVGPLEPGDVVVTNDPYGSAAAATHLPDIHLIRPIFRDGLIDYAARKVEALIRTMPEGRYEFSDYIEDDVVTDIPIRLKVALTIRDGEIHLDFTGSDVQVGSALNVPTAGRVHPFMSIALVNYFVTRDRTIPLNAGVLRRVRMTLPEGSVVNPR